MIDSKYYAHGEEVEAEDFFLKRDSFEANYQRLSQTEMVKLHRDDVCPDEDNIQKQAKQMAKALFKTGQKIALPIREETK